MATPQGMAAICANATYSRAHAAGVEVQGPVRLRLWRSRLDQSTVAFGRPSREQTVSRSAYLIPIAMECGPTRCSTRVAEKPVSRIQA
jgi:hypothetical protein